VADYIALFRYVGYLLGTPDEFFKTAGRAKATMESKLLYEIRMTAPSYTLSATTLSSA
jgi:hypothetical protein